MRCPTLEGTVARKRLRALVWGVADVYTMTDLVRETLYTEETIHTYARDGLIPRPTRGRFATWPREAMQILLAFGNQIHPENRVARVDIAERFGQVPGQRG